MNDMNKLEFFKLIKEITEVSNLDELKNLVIKANNFVKENDIKKGSEEFEKFVKVIDIIKFRLKKKIKSESTTPKTIVVSEEQYEFILKNITEVDSRSQQIIDDILDQISAHGEESLSPSQPSSFTIGMTVIFLPFANVL
jgi:flagellin-specific chaperone FliS